MFKKDPDEGSFFVSFNRVRNMRRIWIRRPDFSDGEKLDAFFKMVITDTYQKEGIGHLGKDIENEIISKNTILLNDLESDGQERYFLIAFMDGCIVGTIEYGPPNEMIISGSNHVLADVVEVGTVYVHPDLQRQGIGTQLLHEMYTVLKSKGIDEFCLDSGYKQAQVVWKKKFGEPTYLLIDYWGEGSHHMIWKVKLK